MLGRTSDSTSRVVVAGEGVRSLEVADRLSAKGLRVKVFVSSWQSRPPSPLVAEVLYDKARRSGVTVVPGSVTRALGEARLEAVLADGTVTPCDTLVFVPRRFPRIVPSQALVGSTGGVLVDQNLRTGDPRTYAAGGCAELAGSSLPCTFVQEPSLSGRVAASNCLGDGIRLVPARSSEAVLFGLRWARCARETVRCGPLGGRKRVGRRWGATSACEIVFEGPGRRVLEVETVEEAARSAGPVPASALTNLSSLAYGRFGSSDISLVSDTARLGLAV